MPSKDFKQENRTGVTTRYTAEELRQLDWVADRFGCDRANAPRQLMYAYFCTYPDLMDSYTQTKQQEQGQ